MKKTDSFTIINANVYDGTLDMALMENINIEVIDGIITKIGKFTANPALKAINANGMFVTPGLINLHSHLPSSGKLTKTKVSEKKKLVKFVTSSNFIENIALSICKKPLKDSLYSGVTTVRAVGGAGKMDTKLRDKINKGKLIGPRLLVSNNAIGVEGGHMVGTVAVAVHSKEEADSLINELAKQNVDLIKLMITGGVLDGDKPGNPGQLAMSEELVKHCVDCAHSKGLKVAAHVEGHEGMEVAIKCGVNSIEHSAPFDESLIELMKNKDEAIVLTLSPALPFIKNDLSEYGYNEIARINSNIILKGMIECAKQCEKHNIPIGLGTDAGSPLSMHYNFPNELIYYTMYCGVSNNFALHTATLINAKIAGIDNETGSLQIGKKADMLIMKKDPIKNLDALKDLDKVIVNGIVINKPRVKKDKKADKFLTGLTDNMLDL